MYLLKLHRKNKIKHEGDMLKEEIWSRALEILQKNVSTISYDLWIKSLEPVDMKNGIFYLSTTSETAKQRIM